VGVLQVSDTESQPWSASFIVICGVTAITILTISVSVFAIKAAQNIGRHDRHLRGDSSEAFSVGENSGQFTRNSAATTSSVVLPIAQQSASVERPG